MDIRKICPGCMNEIENRDIVGICPRCGYNLSNMRAASHQMQPFTILAGKYLVGKVIGEGGFGISYMGFDLNLELTVAIKEFYPNGFVTRESNVTTMVSMYAGKNEADVNKWKDGFISEARNLAKFSNLNGIVEVRDFFNENGTAYIVMEYIDGMTLKAYLQQCGGKIPADKTFAMMEPIIRSLSKVHEAGMIHRDISPDNIMITKYGGMKLLDFGAAREYAGNAEKSLSIMLKPGYAPEEQYRSRGMQGPWSDVYALTATIYKCITGITPVESMERMRNDSLKMPKELGVPISDAQNAAIQLGMAVYADQRIQNMNALHAALYVNGAASSADTVPNLPVREDSAPPRQDIGNNNNTTKGFSGIKLPDINSGGDAKKSPLVKAAIALGVVMVVMIMVLSTKKSDDTEKSSAPAAAQPAPSSGGDKKSVEVTISDGTNEDAINKIVEAGLSEEEGAEILQKAVDALYAESVEEAKSLAAQNDFDGAYAVLDGRKQFFADVAGKTGYLGDSHQADIDQERYYISVAYDNYWCAKAVEYAYNGQDQEMMEALYKADVHLNQQRMQELADQCYYAYTSKQALSQVAFEELSKYTEIY